jgi:hypothetical protein
MLLARVVSSRPVVCRTGPKVKRFQGVEGFSGFLGSATGTCHALVSPALPTEVFLQKHLLRSKASDVGMPNRNPWNLTKRKGLT